MLSVIIVIAIIVLSLILAAIGAYVVVHNSDEKEEAKPIIDVSGQYSAVGRPARECLTAVKPSEASLRSWLETQDLTAEAREDLIRQWHESMEETIRTINEGDQNGTATYRIEIGPKGKNYCKFVDEDNFITRTDPPPRRNSPALRAGLRLPAHAQASLGNPEQGGLEGGHPHARKLLRRPRLEATCISHYLDP